LVGDDSFLSSSFFSSGSGDITLPGLFFHAFLSPSGDDDLDLDDDFEDRDEGDELREEGLSTIEKVQH